jgi:hypothetical protein
MGGIQQYDASPMSKPLVGDQDQLPEHLQKKILASPMKKDKKVPKIATKSPDATVKMLQAKKDAGTITDAELKRLKELQKMMETGPGSYGSEQYDKD